MAKPNSWWIVASKKDPLHGWHWDTYFNDPHDPDNRVDWGGPDWIRSAVSFARIQDMRKGDVVVAYQAGEGVLGLATLGSDGYEHPESGKYDSFDLAEHPTIRLRMPVPYEVIRDAPEARENIEFVRIAKQGTVYGLTAQGFIDIVELMKQFNPSQADQINAFIAGRAD